jgi:hypothetical protein
MRHHVRLARCWLFTLFMAGSLALASVSEAQDLQAPEPWTHVGLLRVRDLTPFGILRLDFLPAHAVTASPGTWALEVNLSYQNTFVLSDNVADYMKVRGGGRRVALTREDADAILALGEEAYLVDLELVVSVGFRPFDLTSRHTGSHAARTARHRPPPTALDGARAAVSRRRTHAAARGTDRHHHKDLAGARD